MLKNKDRKFILKFLDYNKLSTPCRKSNLYVCVFIWARMEFFEIETNNGIRTVTISNPKKKNAVNKPAYLALAKILNTAATDDQVKCVVLTGKGDFFR